jgi:hypothetical protein
MKLIAIGTKRIPVYGITVEGSHEYFANDILVANSLLYAIVGLQRYGGEPAKILGDSALDGIPKGQIVKAEGVASFVSAGDFREGKVEL